MRRTKIALTTEWRKKPSGKRYEVFCVRWPKVGGGRHRQYFSNWKAANILLEQKKDEVSKYGITHLGFTDRQRFEYASCAEKLLPFGRSLSEAVDYYVAHLKVTTKSCTAAELVEQVLAAKIKDGLSKRYISDLRSRLSRFATAFNGKAASDIETSDIDNWLRGLPVGPTTRNNFRRCLVTMFAYAVNHGYASSNPATKTGQAKEVDAPAGILTVEQTARLLECACPDMLPFWAIGAFAGLRRAEIERLDWSEVDFDASLIKVPAKSAKMASRRLVAIQPNLSKWLAPCRTHTGRVCPANLQKKINDDRERAGLIAEWPQNALRHGFGSYHLARFNDAAKLALEMGNSPAMIFKHYRALVRPKDAQCYWAIEPKGRPVNVVEMRSAV